MRTFEYLLLFRTQNNTDTRKHIISWKHIWLTEIIINFHFHWGEDSCKIQLIFFHFSKILKLPTSKSYESDLSLSSLKSLWDIALSPGKLFLCNFLYSSLSIFPHPYVHSFVQIPCLWMKWLCNKRPMSHP